MNTMVIIIGAFAACVASFSLGRKTGSKIVKDVSDTLKLASLYTLVQRFGGSVTLNLKDVEIPAGGGVLFEVDRETGIVQLSTHHTTPEGLN